jgi:SAM-dependent methyltransferase
MANEQQQLWEHEHTAQQAFATMHTLKPSSVMPTLATAMEQLGLLPSHERVILDIGCGKGRNSIFFAQKGYRVVASDFSEKALADARIRAAQHQVEIEFEQVDLSEEWPYGNSLADLIIDSNTTVFIPAEGREQAIREALRVLKAGGYYFFYGLAREGEAAAHGAYSDQGFAETRYTKEELLAVYQSFIPVQVALVDTPDQMGTQEITNKMWYALFQKPPVV